MKQKPDLREVMTVIASLPGGPETQSAYRTVVVAAIDMCIAQVDGISPVDSSSDYREGFVDAIADAHNDLLDLILKMRVSVGLDEVDAHQNRR